MYSEEVRSTRCCISPTRTRNNASFRTVCALERGLGLHERTSRVDARRQFSWCLRSFRPAPCLLTASVFWSLAHAFLLVVLHCFHMFTSACCRRLSAARRSSSLRAFSRVSAWRWWARSFCGPPGCSESGTCGTWDPHWLQRPHL